MLTLSRSGLMTGGATFVVWALAAGSAGYWGLRAWPRQEAASALPVAAVAAPAIDTVAVARVLGATAPTAAAPAPLASRFALKGVVAQPNGGAALIAVDGQPARPYRVGREVVEGLVLQSVVGRQATLAASQGGAALVTLELPPLTP